MTAVNLNRAIRGPVTAVPIVAGKGVRLVADTENNRWVVEADETELYSNATGDTSVILSESAANFERIAVWVVREDYTAYTEIMNGTKGIVYTSYGHGQTWMGISCAEIEVNGTSVSIGTANGFQISFNISSQDAPTFRYAHKGAAYGTIVRVIGINRIASN